MSKKICICCRESRNIKIDKTLNQPKCKYCTEAMGECRDCKMLDDCKGYLEN